MGLSVLLAVGCSTATSPQPDMPTSSASRQDAPGSAHTACPDTAPVSTSSVPAAVRNFDKKLAWYGVDGLWVAKPRPPDHTGEREEGYRTKYASMTLDDQGRVTDQKGAPRVDVERLDGSGSVRGSTGGFATAEGGRQWWPTVIEFPEPGCWKVTETLGSAEVRFTVHVAAR
ncbi:hypothetical protein ACGFU4_11345 [Streptomyces sp. NPDC048511]|uniref:hypothetical protein n=1 Tax=unclassified Streptomyces TaxID=2593676 RepID=UPI0036B34CBA